ncbi:helix-turn-helix domain protein [Fusobacterium sp. CAG:439]|nr:helix-turn-helix domain protein [Fusobacterium sp. CAG:439]
MTESQNITDYKKKIGANIAKYRKTKNLTQRELAYLAGIASQTLSCIEIGINNPSFNVMIKIAMALEIPLSYIFTFDESTYDIQDKQLLFLASEAFKDLDYKDREIAFKLVQCFKTEKKS